MKSERMTKISIICPKSKADDVIDKLYNLGSLHLKDHMKTEELDIGEPLKRGEHISDMLVKIRGVMTLLNIEQDRTKNLKSLSQKELFENGKKAREIYDEVVAINEITKSLIKDIDVEKEKEKILNILKELRLSRDELEESDYLSRFIGSVADSLEVKARIRKITQRCEILSARAGKRDYLAVFADKNFESQIRDILNLCGFSEVTIRLDDISKKSISEQLREIKHKISDLEDSKKDMEKKISHIKKESDNFLQDNEALLSEEAKKCEVTVKFGATKKAFVIKAWVPAKSLNDIKNELNKATNNKVYVEAIKGEKDERVPIKLNNPRPVNSFQFFLEMFDLPSYKEIDPTWLMFITFPLFFGLMLGDVGYGILTLILFSVLKIKMPKARSLLNIMIFASILTICFGFVFGEAFGFEHLSDKTGSKLCESTGICFERVQLHEEGGHEEEQIQTEESQPIEGIHELSGSAEENLDNTIVQNGVIKKVYNQNLGSGFEISNITLSDSEQEALDNKDNKLGVEEELIQLEEAIKNKEHTETAQEEHIIDNQTDENITATAIHDQEETQEEEHEVEEHAEPVYIYDFPRIANRLHGKVNLAGFDIFMVLVVGFLVGFAHLNLGLLVGFVNVFKQHGFMHAIYEKASWWVIQAGVILMIVTHWAIGLIVLLVGAVLLYLGEGVQGIIELPSIISNMLSYMRLGAVGLASVGLAVVVNDDLVMPMIAKGGIFIVIGILIFTLGHTINIALGIIGPFLHSLRLHYVEFFSKFYKGGGLKYEPFGYKEE